MKKLLALSLLFFLFAQSGGLLYLYSLQQEFVRAHMEAELNNPKAKFETLRMSLNDFKEGRKNAFEVKYQGKMYDVKGIQVFGNTVSMLALHDTKEESLMHEIKKLICHADDHTQALPDLLLKLSSLTYLSVGTQLNDSFLECVAPGHPLYLSPADYLISQDIFLPPPERLSFFM